MLGRKSNRLAVLYRRPLPCTAAAPFGFMHVLLLPWGTLTFLL
jgi:hypothetical protein